MNDKLIDSYDNILDNSYIETHFKRLMGELSITSYYLGIKIISLVDNLEDFKNYLITELSINKKYILRNI